jgi:hypothetical protein
MEEAEGLLQSNNHITERKLTQYDLMRAMLRKPTPEEEFEDLKKNGKSLCSYLLS